MTHRMFSPILSLPFAGIPAEPSVTHAGQTWTWAVSTGETMQAFRVRVMAALGFRHPRRMTPELRAQFDGLADQARGLGWVLIDPRTTLDQQIGWLFKRVCPQSDAVMGWQEIIESEPIDLDYGTLRRTVKRPANELGIALPTLRPGRRPALLRIK